MSPVSVNPQGEGSNAEKGVHRASYGYAVDDLKSFSWSPLDRAILQFGLEDEEGSAPMSLAAGDELVFAVWQLTGQMIQVGSEEATFKAAKAALEGCTWKGLVYVGKGGFIQRLQVPAGAYNFKFLRFAVRHEEHGYPYWFERTWKDSDSASKHTIIDFQVVGGPYDAWLQQCFFPVTFRADEAKNDLQITGKALAKVLEVTGVTEDLLVAEVNAVEQDGEAYFADITNPLPEFEALMLRMANEGHLVAGTVSEEGYTDWDSLVSSDMGIATASAPAPRRSAAAPVADKAMAENEARLRGLMQEVSNKIWGDEIPVFDDVGDLTAGEDNERGLYLAVNIIKVAAEALPDNGIECKWPPLETGWTAQGLDLAVDVFAALSSMTPEEMITSVGPSTACHEALRDYILGIWGPGVETEAEAEAEAGGQEF